MARSLRDLRRKMKAIKSTKQVTKAMELVSASKMRRAVSNAQTLRRYALAAWHILQRIADLNPGAHPYLQQKPVKNVLAVVFSSDRGLCGSMNTQLFRAGTQYLKGLQGIATFEKADFITIGNKGAQFVKRTGRPLIASFPALSNHPTFRDILPIARMVNDGFLGGTYDHVVLLYTNFVSALIQEPVVKVLLPFSQTDLRDMIEKLLPKSARKDFEKESSEKRQSQYLFEPSPEEVLRVVLPQLMEIQLYQAVLESAASEHSARMVAMRNATDNASGLLEDLTLSFNQTRQGNITAELAELSASKAALE